MVAASQGIVFSCSPAHIFSRLFPEAKLSMVLQLEETPPVQSPEAGFWASRMD